MKTIRSNELYRNLSAFLKTRGIELTEGSYSTTVRKGCSLLTEAINLGQEGLEQARTRVDHGLDRLRQVIHEKTAPAPPASGAAAGGTKAAAGASARSGARPKPARPAAKASARPRPAPARPARKRG